MNNEEDMSFLLYILLVMYVVVVGDCDWNAWFQKSYLINENERKSIMCDLTNIQFFL